MNEQLIKLIDFCLVDGILTDKERKVIFKKSEELGISKDECEVILESMMFQQNIKTSTKTVGGLDMPDIINLDFDLVNMTGSTESNSIIKIKYGGKEYDFENQELIKKVLDNKVEDIWNLIDDNIPNAYENGNGENIEIITIRNKQLNGPYSSYCYQGMIQETGFYKNGLKDGLWITHRNSSPSGLQHEVEFVNGKESGKFRSHHLDGSLFMDVNVKDGKIIGPLPEGRSHILDSDI